MDNLHRAEVEKESVVAEESHRAEYRHAGVHLALLDSTNAGYILVCEYRILGNALNLDVLLVYHDTTRYGERHQCNHCRYKHNKPGRDVTTLVYESKRYAPRRKEQDVECRCVRHSSAKFVFVDLLHDSLVLDICFRYRLGNYEVRWGSDLDICVFALAECHLLARELHHRGIVRKVGPEWGVVGGTQYWWQLPEDKVKD